MKIIYAFIFLIAAILSSSCHKKNFEIADFNPFINFDHENDTLVLPIDMTNAIQEGISIPTKQQCNEGYFKISFKIINISNKPKAYYYKVFYQNESYKINEFIGNKYNLSSGNNFYGSWENCSDTLHVTGLIPPDQKYHVIYDSIKIIGNPRDEKKYYGSDTNFILLSDEIISNTISNIRNTPEWFKSIEEKASKNKMTLDDQLYRDAIWALKENSQKGDFNNRWKRNPRVGAYSFLLLVVADDAIEQIPGNIKNISKTDDSLFINPYYTLLYDKKFSDNNTIVIKSEKVLRTQINFDLVSGIYIDPIKLNKQDINKSNLGLKCGYSKDLYYKAQFEQFFHNINQNYKLNNIPVITDGFTLNEYNMSKTKYSADELISEYVKTTDCPCKTVTSDTLSKSLLMRNPGNKPGSFRKENVGISSRIGFTYGKYIAKIKFPAIINNDNVWNGVTCAFWLLYQADNEWNNRSICENAGYIPKSETGKTDVRVETNYYSEIDFEILKTSQYWPKTSYEKGSKVPADSPENNHDIIVTCTNWDLACRSPKNFSVGATEFVHNGTNYITHRWDDWYKALTIKHPIEHDSIFNQPYYYEIDWEPERITWKIGKSKTNMKTIAVMDKTITTIPDNQMIIVFSQEFHDASWWPLSPFMQDYVPFPKNDIVGEIMEITVE